MQVNNNLATFSKKEVRIILDALQVQANVKSNSAGDQKGLDTPGITALDDLYQHIKKASSIKLTDSRNFDSADYAHEISSDLHDYMVYKASINTLTPNLKKSCNALQRQIQSAVKA